MAHSLSQYLTQQDRDSAANILGNAASLHSLLCCILVSFPLQLLRAGGVGHEPQQGQRQQRGQRAHLQGASRLSPDRRCWCCHIRQHLPG